MSLTAPVEAVFTRAETDRSKRFIQFRRLARNVETMIAVHPRLYDLGYDDVVEHLADQLGFGKHDLSIHRVLIARRKRTLVCVPERLSGPEPRGKLIALKRASHEAGHRIVLVWERFVQRQPRLSNMRMIEQATALRIRAEDRIAILVHLLENGGYSTVIDCAEACSHEAPIPLILHLVADGVLSIDMNKPIGPNTRVDMVEAGEA